MDWPEVLRWLQSSRRRGAKHVWLSGGEPTLRKDFLGTLRAAKQLGYQRIKVQSNGLLFSYPQMAQKAVEAGMTEVNLLLKSRDPTLHDALMQKPGALALLDQAVAVLAGHPSLRLEGDILLTERNYKEIPALVAHYASLGFRHFNVWLFSLADQGEQDLRAEVPQLALTVPYLLEALTAAEAHGATLVSLNTPHCLVPPHAWRMQFDAKGMGLLIANPGGHAFMLEESTFELGTYPATCETCAVRADCHGLRKDYIAVHGDGELKPVTAQEAAGHDPRGSTLDL